MDFKKSPGDNAHNPENVYTIKEAEKVSNDAGLDHFQLVPRDAAGKLKVSGLEFLEHQVRCHNRNMSADIKEGKQILLVPTTCLEKGERPLHVSWANMHN